MKKNLAILFIIDPFEMLNLRTDASIFMMAEAHRRGHTVFISHLSDLVVEEGIPKATVRKIKSIDTAPKQWKEEASHTTALFAMDAILMRKDPPVDLDYIVATYILSLASEKTFVMNDPGMLRNFNEKMGIFYFPELSPPSLVAKDHAVLIKFLHHYKTIVLKPLEKMSGEEVIVVHEDDKNRNALLELLTHKEKRFIMAQEYLPEVEKGDKRIFLLDGEIVGFYNRIASPHDHRSNLHAGGTLVSTNLTKQEKNTAASIGGKLKKMGIAFAGIDMIGGLVTEINITSPGGGFEIVNQTARPRIEEKIINFIEKKSRRLLKHSS